MIAGLDLDTDIGSMERLFVAGLCGLAYGLAEVIEAFAAHGVHAGIMIMGGGASRSPLVRQIRADLASLDLAAAREASNLLIR